MLDQGETSQGSIYTMKRKLAALRALPHRRDGEAGQGLAEYALILAFIALVCILALQQFGAAIANSPGFTQLPSLL
jgi:Flp pilus assembly pilin Flp